MKHIIASVAVLFYLSVPASAQSSISKDVNTKKKARSLAQTLDVAAFGAKCDGVTNDGPAITAASAAAGTYYVDTGKPSTILISHGSTGVCLITSSIVYSSGSHFVGRGGIISNQTAGVNTFVNSNQGDGNDNVSFDHVVIHASTSSGVGIYYLGGTISKSGGTHANFAVTNSTIVGASYAVIVNVYNQNDGVSHHLTGVTLNNNTISCNLISGAYDTACRDGLHLSGDLSDFHMDGNTIYQRDDAGLALTSTGGRYAAGFSGIMARLTPTQGTISNNTVRDTAVCIDFSGGSMVTAAHNDCYEKLANTNSGPAIRFIFDQYPLPNNIHVTGGRFYTNSTGVDQSTVKMDFSTTGISGAYPLCNCYVEDAEIGSTGANGAYVYALGNGLYFNNNTFDAGTRVTVNVENGNTTSNVIFKGTKWLGSTRSINTTSINGGLSNDAVIDDYFNGVRSSFSLKSNSRHPR